MFQGRRNQSVTLQATDTKMKQRVEDATIMSGKRCHTQPRRVGRYPARVDIKPIVSDAWLTF